jgi:hypothetical protein
MNPETRAPAYLTKVIEGVWSVAASALGENHLLTQAFETALRADDPELMERALRLLGGSPEGVQRKLLFGPSAAQG